MTSVTTIVDNKWTLCILYALSSDNMSLRYRDLQQATDINPRTLTARLVELERLGILTRTRFAEVPPRVEYTLTRKGRDFVPILNAMIGWGRKYSRVDTGSDLA